MLKLHQLVTAMELYRWCISSCVPYALSMVLLGHGQCSPGSGKLEGLAGFGIPLKMQGWGEFGSQTEPEMGGLEQGSGVKEFSVFPSVSQGVAGRAENTSQLSPAIESFHTGLY